MERWRRQALPAPQKAFLQRFRQQVAGTIIAASSQEAAAELARANKAVLLPQSATPAERNMLLGILLMLLAAFTAILARAYGSFGRKVIRTEQARRRDDWKQLP